MPLEPRYSIASPFPYFAHRADIQKKGLRTTLPKTKGLSADDAEKKKKDSNGDTKKDAKTPEAPNDKKDGKGKNDGDKKDPNGNNGGGKADGGEKKNPNGDWTEEQDKKLAELKIPNTSWKDIAVELGKEPWQCKSRWKEIEGKVAPAETKVEEKKAEEKRDQEKDDKADKAKQQQQQQQQQKDDKNNKKGKKQEEQTQAQVQPQPQPQDNVNVVGDVDPAALGGPLEEDEDFSADDLQVLSQIVHREHKNFWRRIAA
ncbi:hypothetical protein LTS18_008522, partial [Coniosporium uncinatum]